MAVEDLSMFGHQSLEPQRQTSMLIRVRFLFAIGESAGISPDPPGIYG
jgi:hypothetical protein